MTTVTNSTATTTTATATTGTGTTTTNTVLQALNGRMNGVGEFLEKQIQTLTALLEVTVIRVQALEVENKAFKDEQAAMKQAARNSAEAAVAAAPCATFESGFNAGGGRHLHHEGRSS